MTTADDILRVVEDRVRAAQGQILVTVLERLAALHVKYATVNTCCCPICLKIREYVTQKRMAHRRTKNRTSVSPPLPGQTSSLPYYLTLRREMKASVEGANVLDLIPDTLPWSYVFPKKREKTKPYSKMEQEHSVKARWDAENKKAIAETRSKTPTEAEIFGSGWGWKERPQAIYPAGPYGGVDSDG